MFKIGDFSKICRVPVSALRYYADIGLLQPEQVDGDSGYRYYTLDQLPRLYRILALKELGLSLDQIKQLLNQPLAPAEIRGMLRIKQAEMEQELEDVQARLARVQVWLHQIETAGEVPRQEVILKSVEALPVLSIREIAPLPEYVESLFLEIGPHLADIQLAGAPLTIFHDEEFADENLDIEIAFPVTADASLEIMLERGRKLQIRELEPLKSAASLIHVGSYEAFSDAYSNLGKWIEGNGFEIDGSAREIYLRPPGPEQPALTEIQFPVVRQNNK
jgi:DNA-binding transcriptional MerR regulator